MVRHGLFAVSLFVFAMFLQGCPKASTPTPPSIPSPSTTVPLPQTDALSYALSWETGHPERKIWSSELAGLLAPMMADFDKAKDTSFFCPKYATLSLDQKTQVIGELIVQTALYESSWNPAVTAVDAGVSGDKNTWSVGLMQLSVVDQANHKYTFGYTYDDLKGPYQNLRLATAILRDQIIKRGAILIAKGSPGLYWATLSPGGKYDKSEKIAAKTKALSFCK